MANIKNIKVGSTSYDIEALHFVAGNLDTPAQWKAYIDQIGELGFDIVVLDTLPAADATNYDTYHNKIVLVNDSTKVSGSCVEYVIVRGGTSGSYTYTWEKIGTTTADLTAYAKKNVATDGPSNNSTGSYDYGTKDTSDSEAVSADADVALKYAKPNDKTGSTGAATTANTGDGGAHTINGSNFTFTGTDQSIAVTVTRGTNVSVDNHSYTPAGTVTVSHDAIKDVTLSAGETETTGSIKYVESVTHTAASLTGTKTFNTDAIKSASLTGTKTFNTDAIKSASLTGTTSFNTDAINDVTLSADDTATDGSIQYVHNVTHTAATLTGTKTFNTDAIKSASLTGTTVFNTDAIKEAKLTGTTKFNTDAIKKAELTGTTKFNTDAYKASVTGTTLVLESAGTGTVGITTTAAGTGTVGITTTAASTATVGITTVAASTASVGISGGSVSPTIKHLTRTTTAATKKSVGITTTAASTATVGITTVAASTASVGISGGSVTPVTRYLTKTTTAAAVSSSFSGTAATITHSVTQPTFSGSFNNKNISGTIGGSQTVANHSHTYVELKAHTHSISTTSTDVSGTVSVPIPQHKHTVTIGSHTHTLSNHTHTQN